MFNGNQSYSIPQFLRPNFEEVNYKERAFITMKEKKDPQFFDYVSYVLFNEKLTISFFSLHYDAENLIFLPKYRQWKVDLNTSKKSLGFVTIRYRNFHLYAQLSYTKISYLRKNSPLPKDPAFLHIGLKESSENVIYPWNGNIWKLTKISSFCSFS